MLVAFRHFPFPVDHLSPFDRQVHQVGAELRGQLALIAGIEYQNVGQLAIRQQPLAGFAVHNKNA